MHKTSCEVTHSQLLSGVCPWCGLGIGGGRATVARNPRFSPARLWKISALLEALNHPDRAVRITAINNVSLGGAPLEVALPVLSRALADPEISRVAAGALIMRGSKVEASEITAAEAALADNPTDLAARVLILVYYFKRRLYIEVPRQARHEHVLWIIRNAPHSYIAGTPFAFLDPSRDEQAWREAKALWEGQLRDHPQDAAILWNAAAFLMRFDWNHYEQLLKKGQELEPADPKWPEALGHLYRRRIKLSSGQIRPAAPAMALSQLETALGNTSEEVARLRFLVLCAATALDCHEVEKANVYALEALSIANRADVRWLAGDAIHEGNLVLGRLALMAGDRQGARRHLAEAAKTPGSPHLKTAGPNMVLAEQLLEQGERQVVIDYLNACKLFWLSIDHQPDRWISILEHGGIPDFEAYLR
jgi:hypothetical protein